ncbi:Scr1 family TA system antitoxin-like transcriptional regulator [Pseudonocardia sp. ICBG601]|uniref:Scr1 family TA system antitoxin-like transcriptional regulator n=1 Tax=Pseudonocardia sp. ICBG601 TaxID=2846759 RepID=UPI001CF6140F|nr:Scr1 family TA system antitoxin-like transcriptional regulator [Pseudonocardia sp. ICBG601]
MPDKHSASRIHLGDLLRQRRLAAGLSGRRLAAAISHSQSGIVRIEFGKSRISSDLLQKWIQVTDTPSLDRAKIEDLHVRLIQAEDIIIGESERRGNRGISRALEEIASEILVWQFTSVPDLLQTGAYARSVLLMSAGEPAQAPDTSIADLISRQDILYRSTTKLKVVMSEGVLEARFGNHHVMIDQLDRIASLARRNRLDLSVLPSNSGVGADHGTAGGLYFVPHMTPDCLAFPLGARSPESDPAVVQRLKDDFTRYQQHSLRGEEAITAVEDIARRLAAESCATEVRDGE